MPGRSTRSSASSRSAIRTRSPTTVPSPTLRHARIVDHPRTDWAFSIARRWLYDTADAVRLEALAESTYRAPGRARREGPARGALPPAPRRFLAAPPGRRRHGRARPPGRGVVDARRRRGDRLRATPRGGGTRRGWDPDRSARRPRRPLGRPGRRASRPSSALPDRDRPPRHPGRAAGSIIRPTSSGCGRRSPPSGGSTRPPRGDVRPLTEPTSSRGRIGAMHALSVLEPTDVGLRLGGAGRDPGPGDPDDLDRRPGRRAVGRRSTRTG